MPASPPASMSATTQHPQRWGLYGEHGDTQHPSVAAPSASRTAAAQHPPAACTSRQRGVSWPFNWATWLLTGLACPRWTDDVAKNRSGFGLGGILHGFDSWRVQDVWF